MVATARPRADVSAWADERARLEYEDDIMLMVLRVPVENTDEVRVPYITRPIGVIITPTAVVTVCRSPQDLVTDILNGRTRIVDTADRMRFAIHLMQRISLIYLRFLKDITRRSDLIEHRSGVGSQTDDEHFA